MYTNTNTNTHTHLPFTVALKQTNKCSTKCPIKYCINDGIYCRGNITQPQASIDNMFGYFTFGTGGKYNIQYEKRWPTKDKRKKDQTKNFGCLLFRSHCIGRKTIAFIAIIQEAVVYEREREREREKDENKISSEWQQSVIKC